MTEKQQLQSGPLGHFPKVTEMAELLRLQKRSTYAGIRFITQDEL